MLTAVNLRTRLQWIIKRAGLKPWPKLWQNLRSTRETELADQFPAHVAAAWIGNSVAVAVKHYLQVTDEHFEKAVQKAVQQSAALGRMESQEQHGFTTESAFCEPERRYAKQCEKVKEGEMGDTGLELYPYSPRNTRILDQAAQNAAHLLPHQGAPTPIWLN